MVLFYTGSICFVCIYIYKVVNPFCLKGRGHGIRMIVYLYASVNNNILDHIASGSRHNIEKQWWGKIYILFTIKYISLIH